MPTPKLKFTDPWLRSLKWIEPKVPIDPKKTPPRQEYFDLGGRGFGIRVSRSGTKAFFLLARFPGSQHPTRRYVMDYTPHSNCLSAAREVAGKWLVGIDQGKDIRSDEIKSQQALEKKEQHEAQERQMLDRNTCEYVAKLYIEKGIGDFRPNHKRNVQSDIEWYLVTGKLAIKNIRAVERQDIREIIEGIRDEGKFSQAYNTFSNIRRFFGWAVENSDDEGFGLDVSPCHKINVRKLVGRKRPMRSYKMHPDEIRAVWRGALKLPSPWSQYFRLLLVTMQRRSEIAGISRSELNWEGRELVIPGERMKNHLDHLVPLPDLAISILEELPKFNSGEFLISTTFGERPIAGFTKAKERLDAAALEELQAIYAAADRDPNEARIGFKLHDLRRIGRSTLSDLGVEHEVKERVVAHARPQLDKVYDVSDFAPQKRAALNAWANYLLNLVERKEAKVIPLLKTKAASN